jgi:tight adherence protein C
VSDMLLIAGLVAIFVSVLLVFLASGVLSPASKEDPMLATLQAWGNSFSPFGEESEVPLKDRVLSPGFDRLVQAGRRLTPGGQVDRIRQRLDECGSPESWTVDRVLAFKVIGAVVGGILGMVLATALNSGPVRLLGLAGVVAVLGFFAPNMFLYQKASERRERIQRELPDALDLLTITVEAGLAFDAALAQVARNTEGPLAEEFFRVLQEMQIGMGRQEALKALGERANVADLRQFVTAMAQADSFGIPIGNVLRVQAKEMRTKRTQRAEEKAQKVPVKMLFPLIFCVMPVLFVVVIGPAGVGVFHAFSK